MHDYWQRQTNDKPLFPDLLWSRPENRAFAGKLLIVGGNAQSFAAAGEAYGRAESAGIGTARVMLPDSLEKTVSKLFPAAEFAPSTPSGSFSQKALAEVLAASQWADGVLLAGDFGRNSETAILLEKFAAKYTGQLTITKDAADYFVQLADPILIRPDTCFVISFAQLQKLAVNARYTAPFTFDMDFTRLIEQLRDFTLEYPVAIITKHLDTVFVSSGGQVSTTQQKTEQKMWRIEAAAGASVWWLQNPSQPYAALSTSLISIS
jgi:ADP-dependent NAD(P)H-hydrate dehydratase / NAD(P)H-hydrate epimerase